MGLARSYKGVRSTKYPGTSTTIMDEAGPCSVIPGTGYPGHGSRLSQVPRSWYPCTQDAR
eukprot:3932898-Rhodomonas_salina.2